MITLQTIYHTITRFYLDILWPMCVDAHGSLECAQSWTYVYEQVYSAVTITMPVLALLAIVSVYISVRAWTQLIHRMIAR